MSTSIGPDTDYGSSMIFQYDVSNTQKSWLGSTTTNLLTSNPTPTSATGYTAAGGTGNAASYDSAKQAVKWQRDTYEVWGAYFFNTLTFNGTFNTSLPYTASFEWYSESEYAESAFAWNLCDGPAINMVASASVLSNSISIGGGWYRFSYTFIPVITGTNANFRVIVNTQGTLKTNFWWRKLQLEQASFRSPFTDGTRSNTQNIVDLTGRSTITANTLTYNSDRSFSFASGTTVPISVPLSTSLNKTEGSIDMWVYPTAYSDSNGMFVNRDAAIQNSLDWLWVGMWSSGSVLYFRLGDGATCCNNDHTISGENVPVNTWTNVSVTWKSGVTSNIYINGVLMSSRAISAIPGTNPSANGTIGLGHLSGATASWIGKIEHFGIYNTQLAQSQVKQNFNALRGRYGI